MQDSHFLLRMLQKMHRSYKFAHFGTIVYIFILEELKTALLFAIFLWSDLSFDLIEDGVRY